MPRHVVRSDTRQSDPANRPRHTKFIHAQGQRGPKLEQCSPRRPSPGRVTRSSEHGAPAKRGPGPHQPASSMLRTVVGANGRSHNRIVGKVAHARVPTIISADANRRSGPSRRSSGAPEPHPNARCASLPATLDAQHKLPDMVGLEAGGGQEGVVRISVTRPARSPCASRSLRRAAWRPR
jgi:hypothetical protein